MKKPLSSKSLGKLQDIGTTSRAEPLPATQVGKYRLVREIGRGGMGIVYEAEDVELKRRAALKLMAQTAATTGTLQRFQREARAAAALSHPNIVTVFDFGEHEGRMFLAMEYVEGRSLEAVFRDRTVDLPARVAMIESVARGMGAVHARGIVHRDLKPGNILITRDGTPKVSDFGLAHWEDTQMGITRAGTAIGTPLYMAPEQVRGDLKKTSARTDVYALGALLYEAATGKPPHTGKTLPEIYGKITNADPVPPSQVNPRVTPDLEALILKAIDKDPARRYSDGTHLADDLQAQMSGRPVTARRSGTAERALRTLRRQPLVWGMAFCTLAALTALGVVLATRTGQVPTPTTPVAAPTPAPADRLRLVMGELLASRGAMERLEDLWYGSPSFGDSGERLREIEDAVRRASGRHPESRAPQAWFGLGLAFAGRQEEGLSKLKDASERSGDDPTPDLLLARWHLAGYVRGASLPRISFGIQGITVGSFEENDGMKAQRRAADEALARALAKPLARALDDSAAYSAFAAGVRRLGEGDPQTALTHLKAASGHPMTRYESAWLRGYLQYQAERFGEAVQEFETASGRGWPRTLAASAFSRLRGSVTAMNQRTDVRDEMEKAKISLDRSVASAPKDPDLLEARAVLHFFQGVNELFQGRPMAEHYDRCDADTAAFRDLAVDKAHARSFRANLLYVMGRDGRQQSINPLPRYEEAARELDEILKADPQDVGSFGLLALVWLEIGQARMNTNLDPVPALTKSIDLYLAMAKASRGGISAGIAGNLANGYRDRGMSLAAQQKDPNPDLREALRWYSDILKANPADPVNSSNRGMVYFYVARHEFERSGDPTASLASAIRDFQGSVTLHKEAAVYRQQLAMALLFEGDVLARAAKDPRDSWKRTVGECSEGLVHMPNHAAFFAIRSQAELKYAEFCRTTGEDPAAWIDRGLADLAKSAELSRSWSEYARLGQICEGLGRAGDALKAYGKALELRPPAAQADQIRKRVSDLNP